MYISNKSTPSILRASVLMLIFNLLHTSCSQPPEQRYPSGGLGLSKQEWEYHHSAPTSQDSGYYRYEGGKYVLNFWDEKAGYIACNFKEPVTIDVARNESKNLIPADSKLVVTYRPGSTIEVDLYKSESLKNRFGDEAWIGGGPGDFIVMYRVESGTVKSIIIATGNNP